VMAGGILARVNTVFGVDISLGDAVDAFTIERVAAMVRDLVSARIGDLTEAEAAGLLEKMEPRAT
jgi:hypothetical protein